MLGKKSRLNLERLESREVPAAIYLVAAPPVLAVTVAPVSPAPTVDPTTVVIGIAPVNTTLVPSSGGSQAFSPVPDTNFNTLYSTYDPNHYFWTITPSA